MPDNPDKVTMDRLEDQVTFYSAKSKSNQNRYKWLKGVTILSAAAIPILSTADWITYGSRVAAGLGVVITVIEGFQQLNKHQLNWTSYRATAEALKHEKYLYLAHAGAYQSASNPAAALAERVEALISAENSNWIATSSNDQEKKPATT